MEVVVAVHAKLTKGFWHYSKVSPVYCIVQKLYNSKFKKSSNFLHKQAVIASDKQYTFVSDVLYTYFN